MTMLLYAPAPLTSFSSRIDSLGGTIFQKRKFEVCNTINELSKRLRAPKDSLTILVLLFSSREDILDALSIRHLFRDVRLIIVAPDLDDDTIALAHRLRPRYLTYSGRDFSALSSVVAKIYNDHERGGFHQKGRGYEKERT